MKIKTIDNSFEIHNSKFRITHNIAHNMKSDPEKLLESILFAYGEPITIKKLAQVSKYSSLTIKAALEKLSGRLKETSGLRLITRDDKVQLVSDKEYAAFIEKLFKQERKEDLTRAALEVLAIVAYQGPVSRADIETIRGFNSAYILRNLLLRGLINKHETNSTTLVYELSLESLKSLGLESQEHLPRWQELKQEIKKAKDALNT